MACANTDCRCRNWCEVKSEEVIDPFACDEASIISKWWMDKISGRRDPEPEEEVEE